MHANLAHSAIDRYRGPRASGRSSTPMRTPDPSRWATLRLQAEGQWRKSRHLLDHVTTASRAIVPAGPFPIMRCCARTASTGRPC